MNNLKAVLQNLKSDKIKERQEGLSSIRTVFAQDKVVANFHINRDGVGDPRAWLSVFQALFQAVLNEKLVVTKRATSKSAGSVIAAQRRLADAAGAVRWLTERTVHLMNKRVAKALFEHLLQTMVYKDELLAPLALDYTKALRCLASYTPHMEHMEDDDWVRMVEMGFNLILGDAIKTSFEQDSADGSPAPLPDPDDTELYLADDTPGEADDTDNLPSTSRKRARSDSATIHESSLSKAKHQFKRKPSTRQVSVSLEQIEYMSLLSTLLRSPSSPLLSPDYPYLASSILRRLQRFLDLYPADSSLLHDYLSSLSSTLSRLSLNRKNDVEKFAYAAWDGLVGLWGTKNKRMKEGLVSVLRVLFPFVTSDNDAYREISSPFDCADGLGNLWYLLDGEAESRWGVDGLSLDSLRLELVDSQGASFPENTETTAFVANTFRAGWNFDAEQALAWAILELQADCGGKLFQLSESMHSSSTPRIIRTQGKRARMDSPIASLLITIKQQPVTNVRAYHLQILLFLIDRHWSILHRALQQDVIQTLLQFVSFDDGTIQSWVFLCFAAIAYADSGTSHLMEDAHKHYTLPSSTADNHLTRDATAWDPIWTNAIRRANVPTICRAACHTAHAILHSQGKSATRLLLTWQRVLLEIETLAKDLDVQGPAYPYDSVCVFLAQCLKVASQDVRLYRMQLEEKVLSWLIGCWKIVGLGRGQMPLHVIRDIVLLLESICGLAKRSDLVSRIPLPDCHIVETLVETEKAKIIRNFLLEARLPAFLRPLEKQTSKVGDRSERTLGMDVDHGRFTTGGGVNLVQPRGRERKVSSFLIKSLEGLLSEWELSGETNLHRTAEAARRSLDVAIIALSFESVLILNGTQPSRRVVQCACKLVTILAGVLTDSRWTVQERALIILGIDPLIFTGRDHQDMDLWEAMLPPDIGTGIQAQSLRLLTSDGAKEGKNLEVSRLNFLRIIWQSIDVQDAFSSVSNIIRDVLCIMLGEGSKISSSAQTMDVDDKDGFAPIRTTTTQQSPETNKQTRDIHFSRYIIEVCITFLTVGPALQSTSGEPIRDKDLTELVLCCAEPRPESFLLACPILLAKARQRTLNLSVKNLDNFLDELSKLLQLYEYARSGRLQSLAIQFLDSTLDVWTSRQGPIGDVLDKVQQLCGWLSGALRKQKIRAWAVRDFFARFLDRYLEVDPEQSAWSAEDEGDGEDERLKEDRLEGLPLALLPMMNSDEDIRVRFRVSLINARLFAVARRIGRPALTMYKSIKQWYTVDIDNYEQMLTRMLSLGNIMIVSSAVRRGPYWHLLETCIHSPLYSRHIQSILHGVSQRMGLNKFSLLFESYASQLAYSIRQADSDILRFPPHLLGYRDRKECAESTFRSFTPTNIWNGGQKLFEGHCKVIQKSIDDGLHECFGDILGYQVVTWIDENEQVTHALEELLKEMTFSGKEFEEALLQNIDAIVASILRTLGDQDFSDNGPIVNALRSIDQTGESAQTFRALARHRRLDGFDSHQPNLPAFPAERLLEALGWLRSRVPTVDAKATTYHVLHQLFADVEQSPLVNEQIRLLNAISLWVASHHQDFEDTTLLHTLIHGATSLLGQADLARSSQSILEWAFSCYRKAKSKDSRFPDILIRICCLAHDYALTTHDSAVAVMGEDLLQWIDAQALKLSKVAAISSQVLKALPAWPHQPSLELAKLYENITSDSLSAVLGDHRITSNKFRLVRRLRDRAIFKEYDESHFAKYDFWRLKECMPSVDQLQDTDIDAFSTLLFLNKGRINSFGSESSNSISILSRHRHSSQKKTSSSGGHVDTARESIVLTLLTMLQGDAASRVHVAYHTLRLIKSVMAQDVVQFNLWPSEYQTELQYLETYRRPPRRNSPRDMSELLTSESYFDSTNNFPQWIAKITILLCDILSTEDTFYAQLISILQADATFAEQVLPVLVHTLLQVEKVSTTADDTSFRILLSKYFTSILSLDNVSVQCLRSIVDVVLHLRHFSVDKGDALSYNKWLNIDFKLLAQNSIICGAYTTALLFLELAADDGVDLDAGNASTEKILYEIYRHIDEPDGFYGIQDNDPYQFLMKRFHHEKQWEKAFRFHGAALETGSSQAGDAEGLIQSFHCFGFNHLAIDALQGSSVVTENVSSSSSTSYRLGWRTETWDLPERDGRSPGASLYLALRAIHRERDPRAIDDVIRYAFSNEMGRLRALGPENFVEIREVVQDLMCLGEIAQWRREPIQSRLSSKQADSSHWSGFIGMDTDFDFSDLENIMATRISLVRSARQKEERQQIGTLMTPFARSLIEVEKQCLIRLSEAARDANQVQIALNSIIRAQRLEEVQSFTVFQEFASVLWCQKEEKLAVEYLGRLVSGETQTPVLDSVSPIQTALVLARLGAWSSEACLEKPTDIQEKYFNKATAHLHGLDTPTSRDSGATHAAIFHEYAIFAERQYHAILKSPDALRWKVYVDRKRQEIQTRGQELLRTRDGSNAYYTLKKDQDRAQKLLEEDSESFRTHNVARDAFLKQAIDMYSRCLQASNAFDGDAVIRLCSLWFANFDDDGTGLQDKVRIALERIPSQKFVFLAHQLSARLSKPQTGQNPKNQENLQALVIRMCREHPFHSLYQVYCLQPTRSTTLSTKRQSERHTPPATQTERAAAAGDIFDRLRGDPIIGERVSDVERLCDACMQWAKYPITSDQRYKDRRQQPFKVPEDVILRKIINLRVPVMTDHTPLDPTMRYDNCSWINRYETTFETAGGISLPKISVCYGTDGLKYKQLFKGEGNDDLRQDAVMEQVFELVNSVLLHDRETKRRKLSVRVYKVIPLGSQAGVLEFVGNTLPLQHWLIRAHMRYRPNDLTHLDADKLIQSAHKRYKENLKIEEMARRKPQTQSDSKLDAQKPDPLALLVANFSAIRDKFRPVMRHYFAERHKTPISWFEMRLNYTRSVATTSIVGHVLGLGDRHISNILLDNVSGQVIHIDLGIAFDQGKLLPTPELVPFRMTGDMVDGMGTSGTQGVFQRCAEETLRVLREDSEVIMTVLEVFKHDPLHSWTASEIKVQRVQQGVSTDTTINGTSRLGMGIGIDMSSGTAEEAADRALSSVARKLDKALSVQYTVNQLVTDATDVRNLARIFHGWSPHC